MTTPTTTHPHEGQPAMTTTTHTARRIGRPMDPTLADRFLTAGVHMISTEGLHGFAVDRLVAQVHAGKAGFYRRWPSVDAYLADMIVRLREFAADGTITRLDPEALAAVAGERVRALAAEADR